MKKILSIVFVLLATILFFYVSMPVLNYGFAGITALLVIVAALLFFAFSKFIVSPDGKNFKPVRVFWKIPAVLIVISLLYSLVLPFFTSHPIFRNKDYQQLIGKVDTGKKIAEQIAPISMNEIRVVDESLAHLLGEKVLGSQPALGSQAELGEFFIQQVNGKLYWVSPLVHSGFFKWLNNKEGTSGYVMVSATNERDVKLVQNINGKPINIISRGSFFWKLHQKAFVF